LTGTSLVPDVETYIHKELRTKRAGIVSARKKGQRDSELVAPDV